MISVELYIKIVHSDYIYLRFIYHIPQLKVFDQDLVCIWGEKVLITYRLLVSG